MSQALLRHLLQRIVAEGPLSVADYMAEALGHPEHGYYRKGDPFGRGGDFITAPEVSQMFGELIGLWCAVVWDQQGHPNKFRLVELGPGRGTLMADALRAAEGVPGFAAALDVHLVETSPVLTQRQRQTLATVAPPVSWHEAFAEVPGGAPLCVIANEFLDALPISQFERLPDGWQERRVGFDRWRLAWRHGEGTPAILEGSPVGSIVEISPSREQAVGDIAGAIATNGGAALLIDYSHIDSAPGDTLQAVKDHKYHDVLDDPGDADLTSHVDFARISEAARKAGAIVHGPVAQGDFLLALGIAQRTQILAKNSTRRDAQDVWAAFKRLTEPKQMGSLFKVLALTPQNAPAPEGFAASPGRIA
jgi:NADH dehydrogenase [ubiquinone] 1 alpha subcomplex assembly factor 7